MAAIKRIGVLTGGGDCPGLNAVIRAVTKSAIGSYGLEVVGIQDGYLGLIENRMHPLKWDDVSNILTLGGTILGTNNKADPSRYAVKKNGKIEWVDMMDQCLKNIQNAGLDAMVCIGGDGTMSVTAKFVRRGIKCVGVPKTIDNDIVGCERTFGFDTAVTTATDALDKVHTTAASHHRVMLVEVMGRNAGWLALHAGIASGSDIILIPEIEYSLERICQTLQARRDKGRHFSIICVSEGAKPKGGQQVIQQVDMTSADPIKLGGIGNVLSDQINKITGLETRSTILGHVQRGGSPTPFDRVLSTRFGHRALELLMQGGHGQLVVWTKGRIDQVPIESVENKQRLVPPDDPLVAAARALGTGFGD